MRKALAAAFVLASATLAVVLAQQNRADVAMRDAAKALVASLDEAQKAKIQFGFDSEERFNWHFIPRERKGLPLKEMTEKQRALAMALLKTGLGAKGYTKAETIRSLEHVLRAQSGSATRDAELYFFTVFGNPDSGPWGWRYEGHHLAQNWTVVPGKAIATSPAFFGANPANVATGPQQGTRALGAEEDLAYAFIASLTDEQRKNAVVSEKAPNDIVTANSRKAAIQENTGVAAGSLTSKQQALLTSLIEEYAANQAPELAKLRLGRVQSGGFANVRFAWMGSTTRAPNTPYYYRIQGPEFLIEYDNTQNNANHQHTVWRDFNGDFGVDVIGQHVANDPHHARR